MTKETEKALADERERRIETARRNHARFIEALPEILLLANIKQDEDGH